MPSAAPAVPLADALADDAALAPFAAALDPGEAHRALAGTLGHGVRVERTRLIRHVAGRRALLRYDVSSPTGPRSIAAKIRAKGTDARTQSVARALRDGGLRGDPPLRVCVPEPLGIVETWHMTLQEWHSGAPATAPLASTSPADRRASAMRLADTLVALHGATADTDRKHAMDDELTILTRALHGVARELPSWSPRLDRLLRRCRDVGRGLPAATPVGVHRDFYPDQVLLHGGEAVLLDLDLYARADPAVDVGNLVAHVVELALRTTGDPSAFDDAVAAFIDRYGAARTDVARASIDAYATLSLARHVAISRRIAERRSWSGHLLALVERRLGLEPGATAVPGAASAPAPAPNDGGSVASPTTTAG